MLRKLLLLLFILASTLSTAFGEQVVGNGGSSGVYGNHPSLGGGPTSAPTSTPIPQIIPQFAYYNSANNPGSAIKPLMWGLNTFSTVSANNASMCADAQTCWVYDQPNLLTCNQSLQTAVDWAIEQYAENHDESFYLHAVGATPGPAPNREVFKNQGACLATGYFNSAGVPPTNPSPQPTSSSQAVAFNPVDSIGTSCVYQYLTNGGSQCTGLTTSTCYVQLCNGEGYNIDGDGVNYTPWGRDSAEYGTGLQYLPPSSQTYGSGTNEYLVDRALQIALFCPVPGSTTGGCVPVSGKWEGAGFADCCTTSTLIGGSHHLTPASGQTNFSGSTYDGRIKMDDFCQALTTPNFYGWWYEDIVDRAAGNLPDLWVDYNTNAYVLSHDTGDPCGKSTARYPIEEQEAHTANWDQQRGFAWLMPSSDGTPDVYLTWRTYDTGGVGANNNTAFEYFADTAELVPANPVVTETPAPFVWGGTTLGSGTVQESSNCNTGSVASGVPAAENGGVGDSGGNAAQVVGCPAAGEPVTRIEYADLYGPAGSSCTSVVDATHQTCDYGYNCTVTNFSGVSVNYNPAWCTSATYTSTVVFPYNSGGVMCSGAWIPTGYTGEYAAAFAAINAANTNTTFSMGNNGCPSAANAIQFNGSMPTTIPANESITLVTSAAPLVYNFTGCGSPIQVYGSAGTADPYLAANATGLSPDTNSAAIISNISGIDNAITDSNNASAEIVNCATSGTPTFVVGSTGHVPPISANTAQGLGGTGASIPWVGGTFAMEGTNTTTTCSGDCHAVVVNSTNDTDTEAYGSHWTGSAFTAGAGDQVSLSHTFLQNWNPSGSTYSSNITGGGQPLLGTTDYGDDDNATNQANQTIPHVLSFFVDTAIYVANSASTRSTNLSIASAGLMNGFTANTNPNTVMMAGDWVRLKSSVSCSSATIEITMVCNQLKTYGGTLSDTDGSATVAGSSGFRFGLKSDGTNPWPAALFTWLNGLTWSADFDIMPRGSNQP